ncbi:MAG TPA: membrane dipeptidase [Solirubrobacterales bacterium]|nr:membrane dipeptidase [Solirubrobacterales bacterium]
MTAFFDGHNDSLTREDHARFVGGREGGHLDLPRMAAAGMRGGIFAVFIRNPETADWQPAKSNRPGGAGPAPELEHGYAAAASTVAAGRLLEMEADGKMRVGRTIADIDAAAGGAGGDATDGAADAAAESAGGDEAEGAGGDAEGGDAEGVGVDTADATAGAPPVAVLHLEGAEAIDADLEALDFWYAAGLRSLGPVWSRPNAFGHGVRFRYPSTPDIGPGLTEAGKALARRCAELGIVFDLAHMNEAGFWDTAELGAAPLVVSHAGVHAICPNSRCLTDAQIDAVGQTGGLVGIVYAPAFLRPDGKNQPSGTPLDLIVRHAAHVAERIGVEHVALGSDFDGTEVPDTLGDVTGVPTLLDEFAKHGFSESEIESIAWSNWRRTLARCWNEA